MASLDSSNRDSTTVAELIHVLRTGSVAEKCRAAEQLGNRAEAKSEAVSALLGALNDPGEELIDASDPAGDWGGGRERLLYVREHAVRALFQISPSHMPQARHVLILLTGKYLEGTPGVADGTSTRFVAFSEEMWNAAGGREKG